MSTTKSNIASAGLFGQSFHFSCCPAFIGVIVIVIADRWFWGHREMCQCGMSVPGGKIST